MAKYTKYRVEFKDVDGIEYRADLKYEEWAGAITVLEGTDAPFTISYADNSDKFNPVNGSGAVVSFLNDGTLDSEDFFVIGVTDVQVTLEALKDVTGTPVWAKVWGGYMNTEVFSEDYSWDKGSISISANDGLSSMDRVKYFSGTQLKDDGTVKIPWTLGLETVPNLVASCLTDVDITRIYLIDDVKGTVSDFNALSLNLANFVDEDNESMTRRQVLDITLKSLGLNLYVFGSAAWIVDISVLAISGTTTSFKAYDNTFTAVAAEDGSYTRVWDISDANKFIWFEDSSQNIALRGGYNTITINYSPYPDIRKVIPVNIEELPIVNTSWNNVEITDLEGDPIDAGGYHWSSATAGDVDGIQGSTDSFYTQYLSESTDEEYNATVPVDGVGAIMIKNSFYNATTNPSGETNIAFRLLGGHVPKSTNSITVSFKVLINSPNVGIAKAVNDLTLSVVTKIGSNYGTATTSRSNVLDTWGTTIAHEDIAVLTKDKEANARDTWTDAAFTIDLDNASLDAGVLTIEFTQGIQATSNQLTYPINTEYALAFFKEFKVAICGAEVNDKDLEFKTETGVDFKDNLQFDIDAGSALSCGVLDSGAYINANNEQELEFTRTSYAQTGSLPLALSKAYVNNFDSPNRILSCSLSTNRDVLRNIGDIASTDVTVPLSISNVFTPISIIKDSTYLGDKYFLSSGLSIDMYSKKIDGSFVEIFDSNLTITEV